MSNAEIRVLSRVDVEDAVSLASAVEAIEHVLRNGFDPADDPARAVVLVDGNHHFFMPSSTASPGGGAGAVGTKVAIVNNKPAPGALGVSATYLLFDPETLALTTVMDGTALTALRTPAVSVAGVRPALERYAGPIDMVVFGAGAQARGHVDAITRCTSADIGQVSFVVRHPDHAAITLAAHESVIGIGDERVSDLLATAAIVVCATGSPTPLFDSTLLRDNVTVIAIGSHQPDMRELDAALMSRGQVVVEDIATALREAGDVVLAINDGTLNEASLIPMRDVVRGEQALALDRPVVFKGTGMSWQDLAVAQAALSSLATS